MRSLVIVLAALALSAETLPEEVVQFDRAMRASQLKDAGSIIDRLIVKRTPPDGQPRRDALLNAMMGRLYFAAHQDLPAASYLANAPLEQLPSELRAETALARGRTLEFRGDTRSALAAFREIAVGDVNEAQRRQATLGVARQMLAANPSAARDQVLALSNGPAASDRWQARYLVALASSLLGDGATAARMADAAWSDAASAPPNDLAPLHVATLRAGLAAARNDLVAERAMLTASNGLAASTSPGLSEQLPVCGDDGVKPSDFVTFGIVTGPYYTRRLFPIAASRPEVVPAFYDRLAGISLIKGGGGIGPIGTIATVSCRSAVSPVFQRVPAVDDPLTVWFATHGLYPASSISEADDKQINAIADRIDSLKARFGNESALLIAPRWQLMTLLETRARSGDPVQRGQIIDLQQQVAAGLRREGAPNWLLQPIESRSNVPRESEAIEASLRKALHDSPFPVARALVAEMIGNFRGEVPLALWRLLLELDPPATLNRRERQAWLLHRAVAQRILGRKDQARITIASAGFEKDLCVAADSGPKLLEQHFSYQDYPAELIAGEQEGTVIFEFDVGTSGEVNSPRIIVSLPAGLFDQPSRKGISAVRFTTADRNGKPYACRGQAQSLIWKLQDRDDFWTPSFVPSPPSETV